jgi:similar to stage IV sporulation protein
MLKNIIFSYNNQIKLRIKGKNLFKFVRTLISNNIELLKIEYLNRNEMLIRVTENDYNKIKNIKTINEIETVELYGGLKLKGIININKYFFTVIFFGYILLVFLSNITMDVQVVHSNSGIRTLLIKELEERGIKKLSIKKGYDEIELIEKEILAKYKNKIEWLEIQEIGTKYIVKVEERKINTEIENNNYQHIVAKRSGIIKVIEANNGDIVRIVNEYVGKGAILISGAILRNGALVKNVKASGKVYAEVWYTTIVEYPLTYKEEYITGNNKTVYALKFLNHNISFFDFKPYKNKRIEEKILMKNIILPIQFVKQKQKELKVTDEVYSHEDALIRATNLARTKIEEKLQKGEKILREKNLSVSIEDNKIVVNIFFAVYQDIGVAQPFVVE